MHPNFDLEFEALEDLKTKGEIDEAFYNKKLEQLKYEKRMAIAISNGGYTRPKLSQQQRQTLTDLREKFIAEKTREHLKNTENNS